MKCIFESYDCEGKLIRKGYEQPCHYWGWPTIFTCEYHKNYEVTWQDALNTRSNILINKVKMTHTKELSALQGLEFWIGNCEEIVFCPACNGTGEEGDNIDSPISCKECNCTGRFK